MPEQLTANESNQARKGKPWAAICGSASEKNDGDAGAGVRTRNAGSGGSGGRLRSSPIGGDPGVPALGTHCCTHFVRAGMEGCGWCNHSGFVQQLARKVWRNRGGPYRIFFFVFGRDEPM
ncbi:MULTISPECIES: hypothetical protein [unclassified Oceanispirochaeta]|uniref:hypothetical protein n=1 Tax=unclassified Oceanispirochaeta TaxID=2635722 RepID=UPI000E0994CE|nr:MULTISPECIES: hypothetical protein [unclassified Oceanispirochaeta]MBF9014691.1 hypothetical protein [Oceanispirochaeta sp. M2]NPD70947.1 hypothetical protein [Oceanispirochaeta sp. M1]RDG33781.1 hypothetical protein DV872_02445 [Oceanispirochaeta sp. M1]